MLGGKQEKRNWFEEFENPKAAFGEVLKSTFVDFTIQAYHYSYDKTPDYGSLVVANCEPLLVVGVVVWSEMIVNPSLSAVPIPLRATRKEVASKYPDFEARFVDLYKALSVGYFVDGKFYQIRPPKKPLIHDLVFVPPRDFVEAFHYPEGEFSAEYLGWVLSKVESSERENFIKSFFFYLSRTTSKGFLKDMDRWLSKHFKDKQFQHVVLSNKHLLKPK